MTTALLPEVLAEQLTRDWVQQADMCGIPLHLNAATDSAWRCTVVGGLDVDAAIQVHRTFSVLVIAERFDRQWKQRRPLFSEHDRNLPLSGPMNARIGPARLPAIQIGLRLFQALEALAFERRFLRMTRNAAAHHGRAD